MNQRDLELALKKQRLVLRSAALRVHLTREAGQLKPAFSTVDQIREALSWIREHLHIIAVVSAAALVARPRTLFRWGRRGYFVWKALRSLRQRISTP